MSGTGSGIGGRCCAALWALAVVCGVASCGASAAPVIASQSDAFVDSVGVNIHATHYLGFSTTSYDDWPSVIQAVQTLGVRNVRDHIFDTSRLNQLTAATGAKVTAIMEQHVGTSDGLVLDQSKIPDLVNLAKQVNGLLAMEGPSEYNEYNPTNWQSQLTAFQQSLYTAVKADPALQNKPLLGPSFSHPEWYADFPGLASYADKGNIHSYPGNSGPPTAGLSSWLTASGQMVGSKGVWSTETGYREVNNGTDPLDVSQSAAAKYTGRMLMDYHNAGVEKTFLYELVDDNADPQNTVSENRHGLYFDNFTLKPAGTAVKNLITLLSDSGNAFTPGSLDYTITGGNASLRQALFQKRDGTFWLALWQDVSAYDNNAHADVANPTLPITLNFAGAINSAATYLPDGSTSAVQQFGSVSALNLNVPDEVMLVQISVPEPTGAAWLLGLSFAAVARRRRITR